MNEENGKHEFNFFLDKQIQLKLLEADEDTIAKEALAIQAQSSKTKGIIIQNSSLGLLPTSNASSAKPSQGVPNKSFKELQNFQICGWSSNPTIVYRKHENEGTTKTRGSLTAASRDLLLSRDSRSRSSGYPQDFVFRHYADPRKYIEQYRREHVCYDTANSSATKSEFLDSRRFYAYNQYSPLAVATQNTSFHQSNSLPSNQQECLIQNTDHQKAQYTQSVSNANKRELQKQTIIANLRSNQQHQYKLANTNQQKMDSVQSIVSGSETSDGAERKRTGSAKERSTPTVNGISVHKTVATKVNVPSAGFGARANNKPSLPSSPLDSNIPNQFHGYKLGQAAGTQGRTLDTLACVASHNDKQRPSPSASPQAQATTEDMVRHHRHHHNNNHNSSGGGNNSNSKHNHHHRNSNNSSSSSKRRKGDGRAQPTRNASDAAGASSDLLLPDPRHDLPQDRLLPPTTSSRVQHTLATVTDATTTDDRYDDLDMSEPSSPDSAVSLGRLSTTCLGVDVTIKPRPKLEASCTYHVFPTEQLTTSGAAPPLLWSPAKSALVERRVYQNSAHFDPGLAGPFRNSPRPAVPSRPHTEEGHRRTVEFVTKEFVSDPRPLNLCPDIVRDAPRYPAGASPRLKANTIKPDLPPTFALQGVSTRHPHLESLRKKRRLSRTAGAVRRRKDAPPLADGSVSRKSWSASTDASNTSSSGGNALKLKPAATTPELLKSQGLDGKAGAGGTPNVGATAPYFKFWNSSLPPRCRDGRGGKKERGAAGMGELDLQQLAEMVLADKHSRQDKELAEAAKKVLESQQKSGPAEQQQQHLQRQQQQQTAGIATGVGHTHFAVKGEERGGADGLNLTYFDCTAPMWFDSSGRAYVSLATRYESPQK